MNEYHNHFDQFTEKIDDSLPYEYDDDGDLVYTGNEHDHPIPVKDIQSHIIKLQEQNRFTTDYQVWLDNELKLHALIDQDLFHHGCCCKEIIDNIVFKDLTTAFLFGKEHEKSFFLPCEFTISNVGVFKQSLPDGMFLPTKDSKLEDNVAKNRYTNMLACKYLNPNIVTFFTAKPKDCLW